MTALSYKTAPFCVLRIQLRLCRDKLMKQTKFHWLQLADCKNSPNRGIRRGCPLTSQTAFGGQLPYKGSLVQSAVRFHHSPSEYHGRLFTNHEHLSWYRLFTQVAAVRPLGRPLRNRIQAIKFYVAVCRICRGCPSGQPAREISSQPIRV